jgi:hypothetical protein
MLQGMNLLLIYDSDLLVAVLVSCSPKSRKEYQCQKDMMMFPSGSSSSKGKSDDATRVRKL